MATFDFIDWGNTKIIGKWVLETGESGVYRGQCTQVVTQFLKDYGYAGWNAARGNGNQVGSYMVAHGEAEFVGTNLASIPAGEIHVVCTGVGNPYTAGHVFMAGVGDTVYEQNVYNNQPTHNYGIGPTYSGRLGRLGEAWRSTKYHYKVTVTGGYDSVGGTGTTGDPTDEATGPNQNRYFEKYNTNMVKRRKNDIEAAKTHKRFQPVKRFDRNVGN